MPEDVETYAARVAAAAGPDGRLPVDPAGVVGWGVPPFEPDGLRLRPGPTLVSGEAPRTGDGGAHFHRWFIARPVRMPGLRGTLMAVWDDLLPPVPLEVREENAAFVVDRLVADLGGSRRHG